MPPSKQSLGSKTVFERHRVLTLVVFFTVCFGAIDLLLGALTIEHDPRSFRASHSYYHHQLLPNRSVETSWADRTYPMRTNSLGMRDARMRDVPLRSERRRVLVLGDSFTEGIGVPFERTFVGRLQARFDAERPGRVELLNGGAVSYSPRLHRLKAQYLLEQVGLEVNEIVVFIDISDIQDELAYRAFEPEASAWLADWVDAWNRFRKRYSLTAHALELFRLQQAGIDNSFDHSKIADVGQWIQNVSEIPASEDAAAERFIWTINDHVFRAWGERGLRLAEQSMEGLHRLCERHRLPLAVVVYPAPPQIFASDRDSRQVRAWREFAGRNGATFIDLFPPFLAGEDPRRTYRDLFIHGDTHWNAAGHALVAESLWPHLK